MRLNAAALYATALLVGTAVAHEGHDHEHEVPVFEELQGGPSSAKPPAERPTFTVSRNPIEDGIANVKSLQI